MVRTHQHTQFEAIPPLCSLETPILTSYTKSNWPQNKENQQTMTQNVTCFKGGQDI